MFDCSASITLDDDQTRIPCVREGTVRVTRRRGRSPAARFTGRTPCDEHLRFGEIRSGYEDRDARIVRVIDGDTVVVRLEDDGREVTVRLIGVDTPETVKPGTPVECGGPDAAFYLTLLSFDRGPDGAPVGKQVTLGTDETQDVKDGFGRVLAYVDTFDGLDLALEQIKAGWSDAYVFDDPFQRLDAYEASAAAARIAGAGGWGKCGGDFHRPAT